MQWRCTVRQAASVSMEASIAPEERGPKSHEASAYPVPLASGLLGGAATIVKRLALVGMASRGRSWCRSVGGRWSGIVSDRCGTARAGLGLGLRCLVRGHRGGVGQRDGGLGEVSQVGDLSLNLLHDGGRCLTIWMMVWEMFRRGLRPSQSEAEPTEACLPRTGVLPQSQPRDPRRGRRCYRCGGGFRSDSTAHLLSAKPTPASSFR